MTKHSPDVGDQPERQRVYYHRVFRGPWREIPPPAAHSIVRHELQQRPAGAEWSDGHGNTYRYAVRRTT